MTAEKALKITREEVEKDQENKEQKRDDDGSNNSTLDLHFQEIPDVNVKDACASILAQMKSMVQQAHSKFQ
jgi:hypothetical protein